MNIIYNPSRPEALTAEGWPSQAYMGEYIRRGTEINMAGHKIGYCAPGNDDDVVTFRGLSAYYRNGTALDMKQQQIKNLAPATENNDALMLLQARMILLPRMKSEIIRRNRYGAALLFK